MTGYEQALQKFLNDEQTFAQAVIETGKLVNHGGYLEIELFEDGNYRLRNQNVRDDWVGRRLGIPALSDEQHKGICEAAGSSDDESLVATLIELGNQLDTIRYVLEDVLDTYGEVNDLL